MNITEFLEARIAEDEQAAARHLQAWANADFQVNNFEEAAKDLALHAGLHEDHEYQHMRIGYERVLAECAAKRRMLSNIPKMSDEFDPIGGTSEYVLRCLCFPYMGHPDYNHDEWAL